MVLSSVLTHESFDWRRAALGAQALSRKVAAFRRGLDKIADAGDVAMRPELFDLALADEPLKCMARC